MILANAFNALLALHGRNVTIERPGGNALVSGISPAVSVDLTSDIASGVAYIAGTRVARALETAHAFTASKDTYLDLLANGTITFVEVANLAPAPPLTANSLRIYKVVTDATQITAVTLLEVLGKAYGISATAIRVTPSNYFRNLAGPEELVIEGREFVISKKVLDNSFYPMPKRNDRIKDVDVGVSVISEVREMFDLGGAILGYRIRTS